MQERDRRTVTLVLGGVRSGKSRFAQEYADKFSRVAFVATARPCDAEMLQKIRRHQADRPNHWQTIEEPLELARVLAEHAAKFDVLLIDCLTIFVSNLLETAETDPASTDPTNMELRIERFLEVLRTAPASVVLVSNEAGSGVVPPYPAGRRFRDALGELNQQVAAIADNAVLMVAGLPLALKGTIGARLGARI
jgi:adenosylcobinamide kinase/adenosylcobinamide-phosphate guanylyltransferase